MKSLILWGQNGAASTSYAYNEPATTYTFPLGVVVRGSVEDHQSFKVPIAGTLGNMRVYTPTNAVGSSTVFTTRVAGSDTALTVSFTASQTGEKEYTANTVAVAVGDLVTIKVVTPATGGTVYHQTSVGSFEFTPTTLTNTYTFLGNSGVSAALATASVTRFNPWYDFCYSSETGVNAVPIYGGGTITYWSSYCHLTRATATTRQLVIAGTGSTTHQNSHSASTTWVHDSSTSSINDLDALGQSVTTGTGGDNFNGGASAVTINNTSGKWTTAAASNGGCAFTAATTLYSPIGGGLLTTTTTEANVQHRFRFGVSARYLSTEVSVNAIAAFQTTYVTLRKNGADETGLQVSYASGVTGTKTDTGSIAYVSGDLANLEITVGSGGNTAFKNTMLGWKTDTTGTLAATEAQDTAAMTGRAFTVTTGTLAATEAQDTAAITGVNYTVVTGTLAATEVQDGASIVGINYSVVTGTLSATEAPDVAAFAGLAYTALTGTLAATEAQDTAAFAGIAYSIVTGILAATEAQDVSAMAGTVTSNAATITGTLTVTEAQDTAAFVGVNFTVVTGTFAATEASDTVSIQGIYIQNIEGDLNATESQDLAAIVGLVGDVPVVTWINGVGFGGVGGSGVVAIAHTELGVVISAVSEDKTDSTTRRWKG